MRTLSSVIVAFALLFVACKSRDPEKCPAGDRTLQPTEEFAELGYPDGTVACMTGGLATPIVWYNGVDSEDAAAAKLTAFMATKGYQSKPVAPSKGDLEAAMRGDASTKLLFVKEGAAVRYGASLSLTRDGGSVALSWRRIDCAARPNSLGCEA